MSAASAPPSQATGPVVHLIPSVDPSSGLHAYASQLAAPHEALISPSPTLAIPAHGRTVVLHYSGYGYARQGAPAQLVQQCLCWRAAQPGRRLLVVFHELYARQPPWRKGFWWAPRQRQVIRRLARACDGCITSLERHASWLQRQGVLPQFTLAVPSNVGETTDPDPLSERRRALVVFGGRAQRQAAYAALLRDPALLPPCAITAIHDVGPPLTTLPASPLPIVRHGLLPAEAVAELLSHSALAAVHYPLPFLAKSGIFAAICAHGSLPLVFGAGRNPAHQADGLQAGQTFITPAWLQAHPSTGQAMAAGQAIAAAAWRWYQPHRLSEQQRCFQRWITSHR